jgi:hypothetical protein
MGLVEVVAGVEIAVAEEFVDRAVDLIEIWPPSRLPYAAE